MSEVFVKLMGGLGNQMFQRAFGMALEARKHTVKFDASFFPKQNKRTMDIVEFKAETDIIDKEELQWFVKEDGMPFQPGLLVPSGRTLYEGYFQSEKYFKAVEREVRDGFELKHPSDGFFFARRLLFETRFVPNEVVAIHVRRGDYVKPPFNQLFAQLGMDYYSKAIDLIEERVPEDKRYLVFGDEGSQKTEEEIASYVEKKGRVCHLMRNLKQSSEFNLTDAEELVLMRKCSHQIIANSSFSWWAAWLNKNKDKEVIAPKTWFIGAHALTHDTRDLIPENWKKI